MQNGLTTNGLSQLLTRPDSPASNTEMPLDKLVRTFALKKWSVSVASHQALFCLGGSCRAIVIPSSGLTTRVDRSRLVLFMNLQCPGRFKNQKTPSTRRFDWPSISDIQVIADLNVVALVGRFVLGRAGGVQ